MGFTQVRDAKMRNTLLLLGCIICVLGSPLGALQYTGAAHAEWVKMLRVRIPSQYALGLLLYEKWATTGGLREKE